jgi:hypothetical protein
MAHDRPDLLSPGRGVTVDRAVAAGWLGRLEGAGGESLAGIGEQGLTLSAEFLSPLVMVLAETSNQQFHGTGLAP